MEVNACISLTIGDGARVLDFDVIVHAVKEWDDDGCPDPSVTGNSMTGRRGTGYWVADGVTLNMTDGEIARRVRREFEHLNLFDDPEVERAIERLNGD